MLVETLGKYFVSIKFRNYVDGMKTVWRVINQEVMGVFVNHTFNVLGEFSMCQTLTSISAYYLTISAYFFLRDIYTTCIVY